MSGKYERTETGGYRRRVTDEHWTDISNAPIYKGDILKIYNQEDESRRTFQVFSVDDSGDANSPRIIGATLMDTSLPGEPINVDIRFPIPRSTPVMGIIVRVQDKLEKLSQQERMDLIALELYKFLMSRTAHNYGAPFKLCVQFLTDLGLLESGMESEAAKNRIRAVMKLRSNLFRSAGGLIFGTGQGEGMGVGRPMDLVGGGGTFTVRRVRMGKVHQAIRLLLESGLFGELVLEE